LYRNESGEIVEPYQYFASRGSKMIRLRLWHTPENLIDYCGNPITSSNLADVIMAAQKVKASGMGLMLAIHYGDYFNDPAKQLRPAAWEGLEHQVLLDSIYQYTYNVVEQLHLKGASPDIVGIGNETTWGFVDETVPTNGFEWPEDAEKFNAGLSAVDQFNTDYNLNVRKAIHLTEGTAIWGTELFTSNGISNYDIIGLSFYPYFSPETSLEEMGQLVNQLKSTYNYDVMIFETGFIWTTQNSDGYGNFIGNNGTALSYPVSPGGQKEFLIDLAQVVSENMGSGLFYWEPGWISSEMCDLWGRGSSYENASLFNFNDNNSALPAFDFFGYCDTLSVNNDLQKRILIYPNPVVNRTLKVLSSLPLKSWRLFNISGQIVETGLFKAPDSSHIILSNECGNGLYFLQLTTFDGRRILKKIIDIQ